MCIYSTFFRCPQTQNIHFLKNLLDNFRRHSSVQSYLLGNHHFGHFFFMAGVATFTFGFTSNSKTTNTQASLFEKEIDIVKWRKKQSKKVFQEVPAQCSKFIWWIHRKYCWICSSETFSTFPFIFHSWSLWLNRHELRKCLQ